MQTKLTLKSSSMLFFSNVNLLRNVEVEVDTDKLTVSDLKNINRYIKSGSILSTEGVLPEPEEVEVAVEAQAVVEEAPVEVVTEQTSTVEEAPAVEAEQPVVEEVVQEEAPVVEDKASEDSEKPTPKKRTTTRKKTA